MKLSFLGLILDEHSANFNCRVEKAIAILRAWAARKSTVNDWVRRRDLPDVLFAKAKREVRDVVSSQALWGNSASTAENQRFSQSAPREAWTLDCPLVFECPTLECASLLGSAG
jgi:hypothetical protein